MTDQRRSTFSNLSNLFVVTGLVFGIVWYGSGNVQTAAAVTIFCFVYIYVLMGAMSDNRWIQYPCITILVLTVLWMAPDLIPIAIGIAILVAGYWWTNKH